MSIVKSYAIGNGDMYYIRHNSDNFSVIDCNLPADRMGSILADIKTQSTGKTISRFISTHPDQDHISGLVEFDNQIGIWNFYCVNNSATKPSPTADFDRYVSLRDGSKAYHIFKGCSRRWMNDTTGERGSSGISVLWPATTDPDFKSALADAAAGMTPNNISPIVQYSLNAGVRMLWMGDLETDFMEKIIHKVDIPKINILFAPHHGRDSGKVPKAWLERMDPELIVIGEAPSEYLNYYQGYNIITQNSCGDILFDCGVGKVDVYVGDNAYSVNYLVDDVLDHSHGLYYLGSVYV